ncbi:MAG TPA: CoA ester lyase [Thermodesulfobacteriota bacterium]
MTYRSMLFVPVLEERFVAKAHTRGADAVILDLEDSIAPNAKARAREAVRGAAAEIAAKGVPTFVRVNHPGPLTDEDVAAAVGPHVTGLMVPKVESADQVRAVARAVEAAERSSGRSGPPTVLVPVVETPAGVLHAEAIARADGRVAALAFGSEDFAAAMEVQPTPETLAVPAQLVTMAAAAAGLAPLGLAGSIAEFRDVEAFAAVARHARSVGFLGSPCIHPAQVPVLNAAFAPSPAEVDWARRVVATYDAALAEGRGAASVDGRMIDVPVYERAKRVLARAGAGGQ